MKKIIALLITVLCVFSALCVSASAASAKTEIAEIEKYNGGVSVEFDSDFYQITYNGVVYTRFNDNLLYSSMRRLYTDINVLLTKEQKETLIGMTIDVTEPDDIIYAVYNLKSGGQMTFVYMKDEYIDSYNDAMRDNWETAKIDFNWPEDNILTVSKESIKQNKTNLFIEDFNDEFGVFAPIAGKDFGIRKGTLYVEGDKYYYVDFDDAGIVYNGGYDISNYANVLAYEIKDEMLANQIKTAIQENYGEELGFFEDDKFTAKVSDIFLIIVFAVVPLAIFILFLVMTLRSKTRYKKFFGTITVLSAVELIIFAGLVVLFNIFKA